MATNPWDAHDAEELIRLKDRRLRRQVRFQLYAYSPFYRRLLDSSGVRGGGFDGLADLGKLPTVDRPALAASSEEFLLAPSRALMQRWGSGLQVTEAVIRLMLRGDEGFDKELQQEYQPVHTLETTGTTGEPLPIRLTRRDLAVLAVQGRRMLEVAGLGEGDVLLNLMEPISAGGYWPVWAGAVGLGIEQLSPGLLDPESAAALALKMKATAVSARAEDAMTLLEAAGRGRPLPDLRTIILAPEAVPAGLRRRLAERGGERVKLIGTYGFAEGRAVWMECAEGAGRSDAGYHTSGDLDLVEVVSPADGKPVRQGKTGEVVFTGLDQRGTALARYRPGDLAVGGLRSERCPYCGRTIDRILGPIRRASRVIAVQTAGEEATAIDVESLVAALAHPALSGWRVEVSKLEGDPNAPDEVYLFYESAPRSDPGAIAIELDRILRKEVGLRVTQFVLGESLQRQVIDMRSAGGEDSARTRVWPAP